jgi:hypothetical protein
MSITIIDPRQPGRQHVDSYWAATAKDELEHNAPVTADMDARYCVDQKREAVCRIHDLSICQRAMYRVYEIQDRLP